jgi:hypothetical protein
MKLKTEKSIEKYMRAWVKLAGRTSILARDMSWVEEEMENILNELASQSLSGNIKLDCKAFGA